MSVPLPAPDGPVTTNTGRTVGLPVVEEANQLVPLSVGQAADRLRLADAALVEQARCFHATELRHRHQHVEHLRGRDELGWLAEDLFDRDRARLQILLELCTLDTDVIRSLERFHPLVERADGSLYLCLRRHHERSILPTYSPRAMCIVQCFLAFTPLPTASSATPKKSSAESARNDFTSSSSSARTRVGASGSANRTVPSATCVAPHAINSSACRPVSTPPMPMIGNCVARRAALTAASATGRSAGPE